MRHRTNTIVTAALAVIALLALFALRFLGLYSHQALAVVLVAGLLWAILGRGGLVWKGRLRSGLRRVSQLNLSRREMLEAAGRASFWGMVTVACLWVFPRSVEMLPIVAVLAGVSLLRIATSFVAPGPFNPAVTVLMVIAGAVLLVDLGRGFVRGEASVQIEPPFEGEWLVVQGGPSPLQNHHLAMYNQRFALELVRLEDGNIFDAGHAAEGNAGVHGWEQSLLSPVEGRVVFARGDMDDVGGFESVDRAEDAAGNLIVIQMKDGLHVLLGHLRQGSLRVTTGDHVQVGDPLAQVGNSGNSSLPHLHLQVQTHADLWDPDNLTIPFAFDTNSRVPVRNDLVLGRQ